MNDQDHAGDRELDETLRRALRGSPESHDYQALVAGTHRRAARIRRRRAVMAGAATTVLVPALVGGVLLAPRLLDETTTPVRPAATSTGDPAPVTGDPAPGTGDPAPATGDPSPATGDPAPPTDAPVVPWQDGAPAPAPSEGAGAGDVESGNEWQVPDPRPTGVAALEDLGAPRTDMSYDRLAPAMGAMSCGAAGEGGLLPVGGRNWSFYTGEPGDDRSMEITVTAWEDGAEAMQGLREDGLYCTWDNPGGAGSVQSEAPWPGAEDDPDRYLNEAYPAFGYLADTSISVAAVRTGDYLVVVTSQDPDAGAAERAALEIAEKSAENLAILDPEHGQE